MKQVVVITAGTGDHRDLEIDAGTTARDILNEMGLQGYALSKDDGHRVFGESENVYTEVDDGEKLFVASKTDVGDVTQAQSHQSVASINRNGKAVVVTPPSSTNTGESVLHVKRNISPLWQERGWKRDGRKLKGYYQTKYGASEGYIVDRYIGCIQFFIFNPPKCLKKHPHWECFFSRGAGKYEIHFSRKSKTPDEGIMAIENILTEAHKL